MPGIAGIISKQDPQACLAQVRSMVKVLRHESYYLDGVFQEPALGLHVGWTADPDGYCPHLPVVSKDGRTVLFFAGENLAPVGEGQDSGPDIGRVLRFLQANGAGGIETLDGWFHGLLLDRSNAKAYLFNDRYGMQRLYYFEEGDELLFASEAKAILAVRPRARALDEQGLGEFLSADCVMEDRTLFSGVRTLPGGSLWTLGPDGTVERRLYFDLASWELQEPMESEALHTELGRVVPDAVSRQLAQPKQLAISLTGGLDTRLIMAMLATREARFPCYTFGGMYRDSLDVLLARSVAEACGFEHQVIPLGEAFLNEYARHAERTVFISEGGLSAAGAYELYLNRIARGFGTRRLTGNYGSEVFRMPPGFKAILPNPMLVHRDVNAAVNRSLQTFARVAKCHPMTFCLFRQAPWYGYGRLAVEQSQLTLRTPFMDNRLVRLMYRGPNDITSRIALQRRLIGDGCEAMLHIPTDRALRGKTSYWSAKWSYFKSHFAFKADYMYKSGMPQWMEHIHHLLGPLTPEKRIIGCHRFTHFRIWFRSQLAGYVREVLLDPLTLGRGYFNRKGLEEMVRRHLKGDRNYTSDIDKALTLELIQRTLLAGS